MANSSAINEIFNNQDLLDLILKKTSYGNNQLTSIMPNATTNNYIIAGTFSNNVGASSLPTVTAGTTNLNITVPYTGYYNVVVPGLINNSNSASNTLTGYLTINGIQTPFSLSLSANSAVGPLFKRIYLRQNDRITGLTYTKTLSDVEIMMTGLLLTAESGSSVSSVNPGTIPYWVATAFNNSSNTSVTTFTAPISGTYRLNMSAHGMNTTATSSSNSKYFSVKKQGVGGTNTALSTFGGVTPLVYTKTLDVQMNKGDSIVVTTSGMGSNRRYFTMIVSLSSMVNTYNQ